MMEQLKKGDLYDHLMQIHVSANPEQNVIFIPALQETLLIMVYVTMFGKSNLTRYRNFYPYVSPLLNLHHFSRRYNEPSEPSQVFHYLNSLFYSNIHKNDENGYFLELLQRIYKLKKQVFRSMKGKLSQHIIEDIIQGYYKANCVSCLNYVYNEPNFVALSNLDIYRNLNHKVVFVEENASFDSQGVTKTVTMLHIVGRTAYYKDNTNIFVELRSIFLSEAKVFIVMPITSVYTLDVRTAWNYFNKRRFIDNITLIMPEIHNLKFQADLKEKFESIGLGNIFLQYNRPIGVLQKPDAYRDITNFNYKAEMTITRNFWNVTGSIDMSDSLTTPKKERTELEKLNLMRHKEWLDRRNGSKRKNKRKNQRRKGKKGRKHKKRRKGKKHKRDKKNKKRKNKEKQTQTVPYTNQSLTQTKFRIDKPFYIVILQNLYDKEQNFAFKECPKYHDLKRLVRHPVMMTAYISNPGVASEINPVENIFLNSMTKRAAASTSAPPESGFSHHTIYMT
ncbi:hypothetical protein A3Q56_03382 [Intoshia linei]|uniref:Serpin domain-containing protein n=1 Tax=Intoshia linei TaxID=1819745 RepID=A0A177B3N1_9BILA|nr:hypothetical protein A3Q56_03382 [Intoshia linei]